MDLLVVTPNGFFAQFDAGEPYNSPYTVYEAKTGYQFMNNPNVSHTILDGMGAQFTKEAVVARICHLVFIIAVDNRNGAIGIRNYFPVYDVRYIPLTMTFIDG